MQAVGCWSGAKFTLFSTRDSNRTIVCCPKPNTPQSKNAVASFQSHGLATNRHTRPRFTVFPALDLPGTRTPPTGWAGLVLRQQAIHHHPLIKPQLVIKVVPLSRFGVAGMYVGRVVKELRRISALDHPNIVPIVDFFFGNFRCQVTFHCIRSILTPPEFV